MKILLFTDCSVGVIGYHVDHAIALKKAGVDIFAVVSSKELEPGLIQSMREAGIPMILLSGLERHKNMWKHIFAFSSYIQNNEINYVHVQTNWQLMLISVVRFFLLFRKRLSITYTIHAYRHNDPKKVFFARVIIGILLFLLANRVIYTCNFLYRKFSFLSYKMFLVPIGVPDLFMKEPLSLPDRGLHLIFPAIFRKGKNQDLIIKAFAHFIVRSKDQNSSLFLPGDGPLLDEMKSLAKTLGIADRVYFPGYCTRNTLCELERLCNVAVIPTNVETYGLCIVEPFVLGKCILTRKVGIAEDIIKEEVNGFYFNNSDDLEELFMKLSKDITLVNSIGFTNFKLKKKFNWAYIVEKYYIPIYKS